MLGERAFGHLVDGKEARHAFRVHDERVHTRFRWRVDLEVRHVGAGPGLAVPPHQALFLRVPRLALRVAGGTVVEDAAVGRPGPGPVLHLMHAVGVAVVTTGHLVALLGPAAGEDPAAGRGAAIVLQLPEARQLLAGFERGAGGVGKVGDCPAVHLLGQLLRGWLFRNLVRPADVHDRVRVGAALGLVALAHAQEQLAHDLHVGTGLTRAVGPLPVPLQPAAAVDQRAILLGEAGGGQADHFGLDTGRIDIVEWPGVAPELRGFGSQRVHDHQHLSLPNAAVTRFLSGSAAIGLKPWQT